MARRSRLVGRPAPLSRAAVLSVFGAAGEMSSNSSLASGGGSSPFATGKHPQNQHGAFEGDGENIAWLHLAAGGLVLLMIDANVTGNSKLLRGASSLHH